LRLAGQHQFLGEGLGGIVFGRLHPLDLFLEQPIVLLQGDQLLSDRLDQGGQLSGTLLFVHLHRVLDRLRPFSKHKGTNGFLHVERMGGARNQQGSLGVPSKGFLYLGNY